MARSIRLAVATALRSVPEGDAHFNDWLTLPSPCLAPVIFFTSPGGAWFAVSG